MDIDYRKIIESRYNRQNWQLLLRDIFKSRVEFWATPYEISTNSLMAKQALWLGTISLSDDETIAIYEVELSDSVDIERNRRGIRDMLLTEWRNRDAGAFMFCYRKTESVLRFSYVSESWNFAEDGTYQKKSTDTKRYTYLLGEGHRSRTAIQQFEELKKSDLNLKALTKAFSVEAVSKMFFDEYKKNYEDIIQFITGKRMVKVANKWEEQVKNEPCEAIMQEFAHFPNPEKSVRDYVKKLMGRLVFLQFLQKKGWLGVKNGEWGSGDAEFLQTLYKNCDDKDHFVDKVLEELFNELNTEHDVEASHFKVPYLNGGLFEREATDETEFPLPAKYMQQMLDFFASYNFTIDENDPDDAEVGVDPEMLGRIFENLLEDNKDKGAFYTPKEIVTYMCRESLIAYLQTDIEDEETKETIRQFVTTHERNYKLPSDTDQKLKDVKICDPAIGSGAFPMGLLKELFQCRTALEGIEQGKAAEIKKHIIQNNIYGVDIERGAVDIARLRFWLSLIVDEETPHALPNLDYKIVEGNSLITTFDGQYIDLSLNWLESKRYSIVKIRPEKKALQAEQKRFFTLSGEEKYRSEIAIKNHILNIIWYQLDYEKHSWEDATIEQAGLFGATTSKSRKKKAAQVVEFTQERQTILDKCEILMAKLNDKSKPLQERASINIPFFEWQTVFSDVFEDDNKRGFDIIIGNPPYVRQEKMAHSYKKQLCSLYPNYGDGTADMLVYFFGLGVNILHENGILNYITSNKFLKTKYGRNIRTSFANDVDVVSFIDFFELPVFNNASTDAGITLLIKRLPISTTKYYPVKTLDNLNLAELTKGSYLGVIKEVTEWQFIRSEELSLLAKINAETIPLSDFVQGRIYRGITTGLNDCFVLSHEDRESILSDCTSKDELERTQSVIKKAFRSRDIRKYKYNGPEQWLLYLHWHFPFPIDEVEKMKSKTILDDAEEKLKSDYPALYKYLSAHRKDLSDRNKDETGIRYEWYALQRYGSNYYKEFDEEKLIYIHTAKKHEFYYDTEKHYVNNSCYIIASKSKFLYCFLNSSLFDYYKRIKFVAYGDGAESGRCKLDGNKMATVPIKQGIDEQPFNEAFEKLQKEVALNDIEKIKEIESDIDNLVYHLYGLTYDEVLIVDPETPITREDYESNKYNI